VAVLTILDCGFGISDWVQGQSIYRETFRIQLSRLQMWQKAKPDSSPIVDSSEPFTPPIHTM
jgi:hypothetical protein